MMGMRTRLDRRRNVLFQNNIALENCNRIAYVIGDEPASAIIPGINYCRADGGWLAMQFASLGTYVLQNNTLVGYGDVAIEYACSAGEDNCSTAHTDVAEQRLFRLCRYSLQWQRGPCHPLRQCKWELQPESNKLPCQSGLGYAQQQSLLQYAKLPPIADCGGKLQHARPSSGQRACLTNLGGVGAGQLQLRTLFE